MPRAGTLAAPPTHPPPLTREGLGFDQRRQQARLLDERVVLKHKGKLGAVLDDVLVQLQVAHVAPHRAARQLVVLGAVALRLSCTAAGPGAGAEAGPGQGLVSD